MDEAARSHERSGMEIDLRGRTALVSGAASGIGAACTEALAVAGAHVLALDLAGEALEKQAATLGSEPIVADLVNEADMMRLEPRLVHVDILVNNAGVQYVSPLEEFPAEKFLAMVALMLVAPFRLARAALPGMYSRNWGRVVNISSIHGLRASAYKSAYVAAKHGLEGLSKVIALEGGPRGVTSNTVCPAYVRTPLVERQIADQARIHGIPEDEVIEKIMLTEPAIKRLIEPNEVAQAVLYLCSPAASFVTGTSLLLDGGWSAR
jgi:3-hydroxybutyrate dehydrogenase